MKAASRAALARVSAALAALAALFLVTLSASTPSPQNPATEVVQGHEAGAGEVLVRFRMPSGHQVAAQVANEIEADRERPIGGAGVRLFHSRRFTADELVRRLSKHGNVLYAEPNYTLHALQLPSDPSFPQLWGLLNVGQAVNGGLPGTSGADIKVVAAWDVSTGSRDVAVGVIDTGIDYTHPDLAPNVWSAPAPFTITIGGAELTCAAGTHGFNAITRTCDPMDDHNHGTHVSGTIGATANNGLGVVGVNWATSIIGAKFLGADGSGTTADAIDAVEFLIQAKAVFGASGGANVRVLSNSWGGDGFSQALLDEIERANDHDMLFVAAAGNSGLPNDLFPTYPASYQAPNVVAVAATDSSDRRAYFSNYGATTVHLGAPGVDILSTTIGNTYSYFSGTSMATPHVSGAAALVLSACALDTAGLKAELLNTVDQVAGLSGETITGGRLNVDRAIRACTAPPAVPTGLAAAPGDARVSLAWTPAAGAISYHVKRALASGGPYSTVGNAKSAAYLDTAVVNDVTYFYVVSAVNPLGESANSAEAAATPKVPADLVMAALTVPYGAGAGDVVQVTDTTKNQGAGVAPASTTRFYLSRNIALDASDTLLDGARVVPLLGPGVSSTGASALTMPRGLSAGTYYIIAKADADNAATETNETNNSLARALAVGPDLSVPLLQAPSTVAPGSVVSVSDTVRNVGAGATPASVTRFYLSTNAGFDATDTLLDGSRAVPALAGGASSAGSTLVRMPADMAVGICYLIARADADNTISETSESNNTAVAAIQTGPDLVVSAVTAPSAVGAGAAIVVSDTTKNQGSASAGASTTRFYLSTNLALDTGDQPLGTGRAVPALAPGESSMASTPVTIPAGLPTGTYYLIAAADADAAVRESYDTNNTRALAIAVGPDLVILTLLAPATAPAGSPVTVTDTVKNQGGGNAPASVTRFYLSSNWTLDAGDVLLEGARAVPALAAGESSSGTASVTVPTDTAAGAYYIIARADGNDAVAETSETNNTTARTVQVGCDLVVSAMTVPYSGVAGGAIVVSDTTKNQGSGASGASITRFYLSTNLALDATDVLLPESRAVPALPGGASSTGSTSLTIPAALAGGTYFVIAKADGEGVVVESSENNNTLVRAIQLTRPAGAAHP
jgi:subtilase family serine protease/subtilisin family serine protease